MLDKINERIKSVESSFNQSRQKLALLEQRRNEMDKEIKDVESLISQTRGAYQALSELTVEETPA
jgi:septal ring factor EnvC (AmiA/AmiB activator)